MPGAKFHGHQVALARRRPGPENGQSPFSTIFMMLILVIRRRTRNRVDDAVAALHVDGGAPRKAAPPPPARPVRGGSTYGRGVPGASIAGGGDPP